MAQRFRILCLLAAASLASPLASHVSAQQTTATLLGTVTDSSGAALPDVTVRTVNLDTNASRDAKTDGAGTYSLTFLPSGAYRVTASRDGFQQQQVSRITLEVEQSARVDFTLKIGNVTEVLDVSATSVDLQTENSTVGTVIDSGKIAELPLNGRNFIQLAQLIPGVQAGTPGSITLRRGRGSVGQTDAAYGSTGASANGSRDTANRFYLDGVELMDYDAMTYSFSPSVDAISEFKVETSTYSAEMGGAPGGQVSILTKSGTNSLRGTLWEFNRNDFLTQSYDAIANKSVTSPRLNRNQFGGNIGGPVVLPKLYHGKDKTFFFFNWESGYAAQGSTAQPRSVPTANARAGNFQGLTDNKGVPIVIRDPLNNSVFDQNIIPASRFSEQAVTFLKFEPLPNAPSSTFVNNFVTNPFSATSYQHNYTARIDQNFSSTNTLSGRYVFNDTYEAGIPIWGNDQRNNLGRTQNVSVTYTHIFSPAIVNQLRGGWHRFNEAEVFGTTGNAAFDIAGAMKLPLVSRLPEEYGPPSISISGPEGAYSLFDLQRQIGPRTRSNSIAPFTDNLSWQKGSHFLKFGVEFDRRGVTFQQARNPRGSFTFDGTYSGSAFADFLLGYVRSAAVNPTRTNTDLSNLWQAYFVNDDWKVTSRLTVNIGLRYDYFAPYTQSDDRFVDIAQNGFVVGGLLTPKTSPYGRGILQPWRKDFGPRIGFAWRPGFMGDGVIRAGYGIYYTPEISNAIFAMAEGAQATSGATVSGNIVGQPNIFFNNPFATAVTSGALNFAVSNDQNMQDSYVQQWNLNLQKKLPGQLVLDVGYVGSKGTHLFVTYGDLNRPLQVVDPRTPGLASLNSRRPDQDYQRAVQSDKSNGNSIYHSLQVKATRRLSSGLTLLTAYTFAKAISGPSDIGGQVGGGFFIGSPQDVYNARADRSVSGFDLKHRFVQTVIYDIPFAKGLHGVSKYVLDGWQASTIMTFQSGFPAPIDYGVDTTGTGVLSRADVVAGQTGDLTNDDRTWKRWFNTSAFTAAPFGRFGNSPRTGSIRLPGIENVDFSLNKSFRFMERRSVEFRTEMFNLLNHYNPDPSSIDRNIRSQTVGAVNGGVQGGITTRVIQLGAKLYF